MQDSAPVDMDQLLVLDVQGAGEADGQLGHLPGMARWLSCPEFKGLHHPFECGVIRNCQFRIGPLKIVKKFCVLNRDCGLAGECFQKF